MSTDATDRIESQGETHYFSVSGYVIERPDRREVFVGGALLGWFGRDDAGMRNILLIAASRAIGVDRSKLAKAFGVSVATVGNVRRRYKRYGLKAVVEQKHGGRERKLTAKLQVELIHFPGQVVKS